MATLTEYDGSMNDTWNFGVGNTKTNAQSFKIPAGATITGFSIRGSKGNTTPCTQFTATITEGGADPDSGTVKAQETFSSASLGAYTGSPTFHDFTFTTPTAALTGGSTQYYLSIYANDGTGVDVIRWSVDTTSPTYADGYFWSKNTTWTTYETYDKNFKIYGTEASSSAIKTINGLAKASVKTVDGLAIASVKTWNGLA